MKFYGTIGFSLGFVEEPEDSGVFKDKLVERKYAGDITRLHSKIESSSKRNDDISINNEISILADPFAYEHFSNIKYVEFMGAKWKINSIEVQRPRLILSIGGLYNGESTSA